MKKGKVYSTSDDLFDECEKRVVISRDTCPTNPLKEWDQVFLFHSNIPRYLCGNEDDKDYVDPRIEVEDEDGYGTGEYTVPEDTVAFKVSAYIHGGVALSMGTVMCAFGDSPGPGGRGFDTTPDAAFMWTDKERYERMCCTDGWMKVYDKEDKKYRPAKDMEEFVDYLQEIAEGELETFQKYLDGECFGYKTEVRVGFHKKFDDGREIDGFDWEDDDDSCYGFYVDEVGDIDFPKDLEWKVFADDSASKFVGDEYDIPEYVIARDDPESGKKMFLGGYGETSDGKVMSDTWTSNVDEALVFPSWYKAQSVAQKFIKKEDYDAHKNCVEKDDVKKQMENAA